MNARPPLCDAGFAILSTMNENGEGGPTRPQGEAEIRAQLEKMRRNLDEGRRSVETQEARLQEEERQIGVKEAAADALMHDTLAPQEREYLQKRKKDFDDLRQGIARQRALLMKQREILETIEQLIARFEKELRDKAAH